MAKIIFEFETVEQADKWLGYYSDGGGENEMYECFSQNGEEYPKPKITESES